jgi:hypothetical protein
MSQRAHASTRTRARAAARMRERARALSFARALSLSRMRAHTPKRAHIECENAPTSARAHPRARVLARSRTGLWLRRCSALQRGRRSATQCNGRSTRSSPRRRRCRCGVSSLRTGTARCAPGMHARTHIRMHAHTHKPAQTHTRTHAHSRSLTHTHSHSHSHTRTHILTHTLTHAHTHMHTDAHTHTHALTRARTHMLHPTARCTGRRVSATLRTARPMLRARAVMCAECRSRSKSSKFSSLSYSQSGERSAGGSTGPSGLPSRPPRGACGRMCRMVASPCWPWLPYRTAHSCEAAALRRPSRVPATAAAQACASFPPDARAFTASLDRSQLLLVAQ